MKLADGPVFDAAPIGMFDSGVGGLTVARALIDVLPDEHLIYVGDDARGPYGPRDLSEVHSIAFEITEWLISAGSKLIVVACNTAAAAALTDLQRAFDVPIIGVIEPGVRAALKVAIGNKIGLAATSGTVKSGAYDAVLGRLHPGAELVSVSCPRFVEFVERGETQGPEIAKLAETYLAPVRESAVESLVLGCTHYPLLARVISDAVGRDVTLISSADETAFEVLDIGTRTGTLRYPMAEDAVSGGPALRCFLSTGDPGVFADLGRRFLGPEVTSVRRVDLGTEPGTVLEAWAGTLGLGDC